MVIYPQVFIDACLFLQRKKVADEVRNDSIAKIQKAENNSSSVQEIDKETQKEVN